MSRRISHVGLVGTLLWMGGLAGPAAATHSTFSYTAASFEQSGSQGYFFDAFSDGALAPWLQTGGTAVDSGSGLVLSDPGTDITVESPFWTAEEERDIASAFLARGLADGNGDFLLETIWTSGAPLENQLFGMALFSGAGFVGSKFLNLNIMNLSADLAARATNPLAAGIYVWYQAGTVLAPLPNLELSLDPDPLSSGHLIPVTDPFTGDVFLRISYDDANDTFSAAFSLDGGGSFNETLATHSLDPGWANGSISLGADPFQVVPEPSTGLLLAAGLAVLALRRRFA
jgi:hypothetical protein